MRKFALFMLGVVIVVWSMGTEMFSVFVSNGIIGGLMVSVDAAIFLAASLFLIEKSRRDAVIWMIVLAHAIYGSLGLAVMIATEAGARYTGLGVGFVVAVSSFLGLRFIIDANLEGDEEGSDEALVLNSSLISSVAIGLYTAVSIDEMFAVMQKFQWMKVQGWDYAVMSANVMLSMVVLAIILFSVKYLLERSASFVAKVEYHGEMAMTAVFSLLLYFMIRGILQNGLGYTFWQDPITGISWGLVPFGFVALYLLRKFLGLPTGEVVARKAFFLKSENEEALEA